MELTLEELEEMINELEEGTIIQVEEADDDSTDG